MNAKTLEHEGSVTATGAYDLAGIVFDEEKQKLYTVDRGTNNLFVYFWDYDEKTLIPDGINPETLDDLNNAHGIALDTTNNHLYVANMTNIIHYYDTNDWSHVDSNYIGQTAVDIDIDSDRGYLYAGGYTSHDYLLKLNLSNGFTVGNDIGEGVIGLAVDPNSGLVYTTTYHNQLRVYDTSNSPFTLTDYEDISAGCGVCVPSLDVSYKPALLTLSKIDDVNDGNCVSPGDYITYTITYGNPVIDTNDPNYIGTVNDVNIVDYLPPGVTYEYVDWPLLSVDPNYDPDKRTYTWYIETLAPGDVNSVTLKVEVNKLAEPLGTIHNYCEIECDIAFNTAEVNTPVCCWSPDIIYVDVNAVGSDTGLSWYHADPNLQRALQKARAWDPNQIWVASGTYKPTTEPGDYFTVFELVNGVDFYGGFAGNETTPSQRNWIINQTILDGNLPEYGVVYVVSANDVNETTIIDGFTITNGWGTGIYSKNSSLIIGHNRIIDNGFGIMCINLSSVKVANCDIINNRGRTNFDGGGIYCEDSNSLIVTNCIISENASDANGGGIYFNDSSILKVTDCIIVENEAGVDGGGIYDSNSLSSAIANCIFTANDANKGGGLSSRSSEPNITNCIFTGNTANFHGGAMYNDQASPSVTNCLFTGNWADHHGGGMANRYDANLVMTNCTFSRNWAGKYGGGTCNWDSSTATLSNCIFWDNKADIDNDEIYSNVVNSVISVMYCDVKGGWEDGEGNINEDPYFFEVGDPDGSWSEDVFYDSSTFQSTLTDDGANWAVNELAGKFINPDTVNQDLHFFIVSNDVNTINVWSNLESFVISGDPYQIYDYHLTADSACIDTGDPNFNPDPNMTDMDGERRISDGDDDTIPIVDMGADEYYWSPADFDSDGLVNFFDYAILADAWLTIPTDQYYNEVYDLVDNNCIDSNDLARFCEDWLWQTAWAKTFPFAYEKTMGRSMGKSMGESPGLTQDLFPSVSAKQDQPKLTEADIEEILKWLAELWLTDDEVRKMITEDDWLKFTESVIEAAKQLLYN